MKVKNTHDHSLGINCSQYISAGTQLTLCKESCNVVDKISDQCKSQFTLIMKNRFGALFDYFSNFNCSSPDSYLIPGLPPDTEICIQADEFCEFSFIVCMLIHACMSILYMCTSFLTCNNLHMQLPFTCLLHYHVS